MPAINRYGGWQYNIYVCTTQSGKVVMVYNIDDTSDELGNCICDTLTLCAVFVTSLLTSAECKLLVSTCRLLTEGLMFCMMVLL